MADEQATQTNEQELAAASAPAEQNEQAPEGADKQTEPVRTFTQEEVNKIVSERQKRWEKKAADERAEAERVATMTAEQKALHEQEKRENAIAEREAALTKRERTAAAAEELRRLCVPAELLAAVDISSEEVIAESAGKIAKAFNDAVNAEVAKRIAGAPPTPTQPILYRQYKIGQAGADFWGVFIRKPMLGKNPFCVRN